MFVPCKPIDKEPSSILVVVLPIFCMTMIIVGVLYIMAHPINVKIPSMDSNYTYGYETPKSLKKGK